MTRVRAYLRGRADDLMKWAEQQAAALNAAEKEKLIAWANAEAKTLRHKSTVASVEFDPQLTLMIAGNTQPSFRGVDEEIQSRVVMVPFSVTIPPKRRDTGLIDKLKAEGPQILRWCIEGVDMWLRRGLDVPEKVAAASAEYFDSEDTAGQFIEAEIERVVGGFERSAALHLRFTQWIERQGLGAWTQNTLIKELRGRGFTDAKSNGHRGLKGLRLRL